MSIGANNTISVSDFPSTSPGAVTAGTKSLTLNSSGQIDKSFIKIVRSNGVVTKTMTDANGATTTIAHGLGITPVKVRLTGLYYYSSSMGGQAHGTFDGSGQHCVFVIQNNSVNDSSTYSLYFEDNTSSYIQGGVVTVNSTNIVITWTAFNPGSLLGTGYILWEAEA